MDDVGIPTSWNQLEESSWYEVKTSKNYKYYYNKETKETKWERPSLKNEEKQDLKDENDKEVPKEDMDNYKELIRSLNFPNNVNYEQCIPKLIFDQRYKNIPKSHRKSLFNKFMRELLAEKSSTSVTLETKDDEKDTETRNEKKRRLEEPSKTRESSKKLDKVDEKSHRDAHLRKLAEDNFLNLLHEKIKMPFKDGEVEPLQEEILNTDPRFTNKYLEDKNYIYKNFTREFLKARVELFESKLRLLNSENINLDLDQVVEKVGIRLFKDLPSYNLNHCLNKWKEDKVCEKGELMESFKMMLKKSLHYNPGTKKDNLESAKLYFRNDESRYQRLESFPHERDKLIMERLE
uniref:WW domain/FF domain containing protein, putative n=1 Tax=Theileria annulata TaxID=5874 RepID=A0A3B0N5T8_THEAN